MCISGSGAKCLRSGEGEKKKKKEAEKRRISGKMAEIGSGLNSLPPPTNFINFSSIILAEGVVVVVVVVGGGGLVREGGVLIFGEMISFSFFYFSFLRKWTANI